MPIAVANARGRRFSWRQRSMRRSRFGIERAGKSTGLDVRRWSLEPDSVRRHLEREKKFLTARSLGSRSQVHARVTRHLAVFRGWHSIQLREESTCLGAPSAASVPEYRTTLRRHRIQHQGKVDP